MVHRNINKNSLLYSVILILSCMLIVTSYTVHPKGTKVGKVSHCSSSVIFMDCKEYFLYILLYITNTDLGFQCEVDESISVYKLALDQCHNQRETQLICQYEIGKIH